MSKKAAVLIILVLYLLVNLFLGIRAGRKSAAENADKGFLANYFAGSRSMGGLVLHFQSNQGSDATHQTVTEMERMSNYILGLNNGIIIGFQTMNTQPNGGFVAYDAQCPNCVRRENNYLNPKFQLSMSTSGIATCGTCGKKYDMNNNGIIQNGEEGDVGLQKYLATTTGPNGFLSVGTKR